MNRVPQIQLSPAWPTAPVISHTDRPAPLLLESLSRLGVKKGPGDEVVLAAERVSSRIGRGMQKALLDPLSTFVTPLTDPPDYSYIVEDLGRMLQRQISCVGMNPSYEVMESQFYSVAQSTQMADPEDNWYIYHSDHLGSSAFLTDASGTPTQHLQYLPFGEPFIEQRIDTDYYTPYTFSAKERDLETGYSYFGARYYDAGLSIWLSVDPLAHKYPSMSAYMYCAGNPVMLVDPDGRAFIVRLQQSEERQSELFFRPFLEHLGQHLGGHISESSANPRRSASRFALTVEELTNGEGHQIKFANEKRAQKEIDRLKTRADKAERKGNDQKAKAIRERISLAESILAEIGTNDVVLQESSNTTGNVDVSGRSITLNSDLLNSGFAPAQIEKDNTPKTIKFIRYICSEIRAKISELDH